MAARKRWDPAKTVKPGQRLALKHGARSERSVAPIREQVAVQLAPLFPTLSEPELLIMADRLARVHLIQVWLDEHGIWKDEKRGELQPCIDRMEKYMSRAETLMHVARLEAEGQKPVFDLGAITSG